MACEEAQELHCFGAEPAADLDADHRVDSAARSRVPGKSRSACAVQRPPPRIPVARRRAGGLGRVWRGGKRWWRQVQAVSRAKGEAIGEDLDAPLIGDRNVQVHVREPDGACHSGASFMAYRATACSRGSARVDRTPEVAQAVRWSPRGRVPRGSCICAVRAGGAGASAAATGPGTDVRSSHARAAERCQPWNGHESSARSGAGSAAAPEHMTAQSGASYPRSRKCAWAWVAAAEEGKAPSPGKAARLQRELWLGSRAFLSVGEDVSFMSIYFFAFIPLKRFRFISSRLKRAGVLERGGGRSCPPHLQRGGPFEEGFESDFARDFLLRGGKNIFIVLIIVIVLAIVIVIVMAIVASGYNEGVTLFRAFVLSDLVHSALHVNPRARAG